MSDPHLDPIVSTWDTRTLEDVRVALQGVTCAECGREYNSPSAAAACEIADLDMRPRD